MKSMIVTQINLLIIVNRSVLQAIGFAGTYQCVYNIVNRFIATTLHGPFQYGMLVGMIRMSTKKSLEFSYSGHVMIILMTGG